MDKVILGINSNHADSSACIIINGKLIAAVEEERFNRIKHWAGFPEKSISFCLQEAGVDFSMIDDVAINTNPLSNVGHKIFYFFKNYITGNKKLEIFKRYKNKFNLKKKLEKKFGTNNKLKLNFIDHHISHISSAFYPSEFQNSLAISIDGFGDFSSLVIAECLDQKIKIKKKMLFPNSLGVFYESMTQLAGFKNYGEEYKLMGLSAFGNPKYYDVLKKNCFVNDDFYKLNLDLFEFHKKNFSYNFEGQPNQKFLLNKKIYEIFNDNINYKTNDKDFAKDIASSAQKIFEEALFKIINFYKNKNENLVLSGGCALNSLANGKLAESKIFKNIYVPFCPGDNGGSIGAALYLHKKKYTEIKTTNLQNPYLGKKYNNEEILNTLEKYKNKIDFKILNNDNDLNDLVCEKLLKENIIGWFQDRMEFGPRALGNRSIISSPIGPNIKNLINSKIKLRESFRPFAPSILEEKVLDWFDNKINSNYMSFVSKIRDDKKSLIPAVTHIDGTGRLQTVNPNQNKKFYNLIKKFYEISDVPILLNTSFNENEPIVMSPENALECFLRTEMDYLVVNNFFINKKS
jgi:carbamoyltransferase